MRVAILLAAALALGACRSTTDTGIVVGVQVPPLPENLAQKAEPLPPSDDATLGGIIRDSARNIREYNAKAFQLNDVIDLYNCVREAINKKKEIKCP